MTGLHPTWHADSADRLALAVPRFRSTAAAAALAMFVSYLPFSGVNAELGRVQTYTGTATGSLQWVSGAFTVSLAASILVGGALAERYGRRRITGIALMITALGCAVGYLAGTATGVRAVHLLWVALAVAGVGGGLVMSASLSLISASAPTPISRSRAIAVWAAANVVGLGVGPFLAWGAESVTAGPAAWRLLFVPVAGLALAGAVALRLGAQEPAVEHRRTLDLRGQTVAAFGIATLVYGVIGAADPGRSRLLTAGALAAGIAALVTFVIIEASAERPVLPPTLFRHGGFSAACVASMTALFTVVGLVFVLSVALATQGATPLQIATATGILFAGNAFASVVSGTLQRQLSAFTLMEVGLLVTAVALAMLMWGDAADPSATLDVRLFVLGLGIGVTIATSASLAVQSVPGPLASTAGTASSALRQLGAALGGAVIGGVFAHASAGGGSAADSTRTCVAALLLDVVLATGVVMALRRRQAADL